MAAASTSNNKLTQFIKCFCGCSEIPSKDIESIAKSSIHTNLQNPTSRNLFRTFLEVEPTANHPNSSKALKCYERCEEAVTLNSGLDEDTYKEIKSLCVEFRMEKMLRTAFEQQNDNWSDVLKEIMSGCGDFLEIKTGDYRRFTDALKEKVKKSKKKKAKKKYLEF